MYIPSPSAVVETVHASRGAAHGRTRGRAVRVAHLASHVRGDVGSGLVGVRTEVQASHVELLGHDCL